MLNAKYIPYNTLVKKQSVRHTYGTNIDIFLKNLKNCVRKNDHMT